MIQRYKRLEKKLNMFVVERRKKIKKDPVCSKDFGITYSGDNIACKRKKR